MPTCTCSCMGYWAMARNTNCLAVRLRLTGAAPAAAAMTWCCLVEYMQLLRLLGWIEISSGAAAKNVHTVHGTYTGHRVANGVCNGTTCKARPNRARQSSKTELHG